MATSTNLIRATDGTGSTLKATVTNARAPGATVLEVNTTGNLNSNFIATVGTPAIDTGIINQATALVFEGHVSGSDLIIDSLAPGYVDSGGSAVNDVVVIKPTAHWSDNIADVIDVSHNDDGTLKDNIVTELKYAPASIPSTAYQDKSVTPAKLSASMVIMSTPTSSAQGASTSATDITGTSVTFTLASDSNLLISFYGTLRNDYNGESTKAFMNIDGTDNFVQVLYQTSGNGTSANTMLSSQGMQLPLQTLSAGSHTIKMRHITSKGGSTNSASWSAIVTSQI